MILKCVDEWYDYCKNNHPNQKKRLENIKTLGCEVLSILKMSNREAKEQIEKSNQPQENKDYFRNILYKL